ncbi:hypothetical protein B0A58_15460 [Flavobacterium branchiophilum NBRC 15030 = ATCC 35035]|uniref:Bacteriocin biosynthesis cyclodehydratase domain-containing protein n=1 Tax=Flavobacterium branchiophilum TaxID=55197 RepID=A0A543G4U2_9FLAO|nr:hypothetical protein [Flavobacterium branchiophilum]OXA69332.1 hypothetical protein B0A58_15460 [Flavobacterium branchiophilum NBRC 15030 = ATCC 35035]TQM41102.1 bacteriocin biosynthesis cyclodehydratase domain-containing protein [Flavobacterium branchiophilum]GEM55587.1 hypothetical protein FB1_18080 [Flavobacterium branchiophilum NBRC 15030 = ATCC 35035]
MEIIIKNWKIYKNNEEQYILSSNGDITQRLAGEHAYSIATVLKVIQKHKSLNVAKAELMNEFEEIVIDNIFEWLEYNNFYSLNRSNSSYKINFIGEFSYKSKKLEQLIEALPENLKLGKIINLSIENTDLTIEKNCFNILVAPFWFNKKNINSISQQMIKSGEDFLYVEFYNNGISLGPLMNTSKGTPCLNCVNKRKLYNISNPKVIIENLIDTNNIDFNQIDVFENGNAKINSSLIINELNKILFQKSKMLYNKSIFFDFQNYSSQYFVVNKVPNCEVCNPNVTYNPL